MAVLDASGLGWLENVNEQAFDFDSEMGQWDKAAFDQFLG